MSTALNVRDLHKSYGDTHILKNINIAIEDDEFLILVGPSGCGKSTLLNMIAGLDSITAGEIWINERNVTQLNPKDRDIAMVFQSYALYPNMTVSENIAFGLKMRKMPQAEIETQVQEVARILQMENLLNRKPSQLSGGQRQRVAMGRAIARNPALYLFDEPLSNLDAKLRVEMRLEIKRLHERMKKAIVYVTHDQIEAMTLGDRIAVMKEGVIVQFDTPEKIYNDPVNLYVAGFIGSPSMNFIPVKVESHGSGIGVRLINKIGQETWLQVPDFLQPYQGKNVTLGLRPELITDVSRSDDGNGHYFDAPVGLLEPTGPDTTVFIELNETTLVSRSHPENVKPKGETMSFQIDLSKMVFFDAETENRIR